MSDDFIGRLSRLWGGVRKRAAETVAREEAALSRGKVAGRTVTADDGTVIVEAGHTIDDAVIERADAAGRLHAVAASVVTAQAQDLREKAEQFVDGTPEGQEARALDSVDDYADARRYVGRVAGVDVTDIRGTVVVPAGRQIGEDDVRAARDAGVLSALMFSARQSPPPRPRPEAPPEPVTERATPVSPEPPSRRPTIPLVRQPDADLAAQPGDEDPDPDQDIGPQPGDRRP
jgi:hypothetical protein